jgi:hypothetical protein
MTRRQRLLNILTNLGERRVRVELDRLVRPNRLGLLSDEGLEELADVVVAEWKHEKKINRENLKRARAA